MGKLGKILISAVLVLIVLLAVAISASIGWRPFLGPRARPLAARQFDSTPARIERGRYLFNSLAGCVDCHSEHNLQNPDHPVIASMAGSGEVMPFDDDPGRVVASNITPDAETGAGTWTDDQIARAIREGIGHDGRTLFPMMPYQNFRQMSDEDLASVVVYMRTLPPVHHSLPKTEIIFPVKYLIRSVPEPVLQKVSAPDPSNRVEWGHYLVRMADCKFCHTPAERGQPLPGMDFAGGHGFTGGWGPAMTTNITPDPSGIGYYDEALFIKVIRTGYVGARKLNALMPIEVYKNLSDDDLKAMFAYLRTVKPVKHRVDNTEAATYCRLCRTKHGAGDQN